MDNNKRVYLINLINEILEILEKDFNIDSNYRVYHTIDKQTKEHYFEFVNERSKYILNIENSAFNLYIRFLKVERNPNIYFNPIATDFISSELFCKEVTELIDGNFYQALVLLENEIYTKFPETHEL